MKERTRKIFIMIVMAALIVSLMAASFAALTYGRYSGGRRDENSAYDDDILDLVGETAFEVSTADELVNAINNGYSYIKIADDAEEPFVINNNVADVYTNLVLDVNGHVVVRNSRNPLLDVRRSISVVLVYDSSTDADGGFYNPVGSALQTSGGTLTVGEGVYESGPRTDTSSSATDTVSATVYSRGDDRTAKSYSVVVENQTLPKLAKDTGDVYLDENYSGTGDYLKADTYLIYTEEKNAFVRKAGDTVGGTVLQEEQLYVNAKETSSGGTTTITADKFSPICDVASCDFYYYYPVSGTAGTAGSLQTYAVVYGYNDVKALASNKDQSAEMLQKSGLVWPYAAIRSVEDPETQEGGVTHARGGAFKTHFGKENTYCIYSAGGTMTVGAAGSAGGPSFEAVGSGVCIAMTGASGNVSEGGSLTISGGTFSSRLGNTIEMEGGEMTVTAGTFTKSRGKGIGSGDNAQITNQTAIIDIQGGTLTINGAAANSVTLTAGSADTDNGGTLENVFGILARGGEVSVGGCTLNIYGDYSAGVLSYDGTINLNDNTKITVTQSDTNKDNNNNTLLTSSAVSSEAGGEEHPINMRGNVTIETNGLGITARGAVNVTGGESTVTTSRGTGIYVNNGTFTVENDATISVESTVLADYAWGLPPEGEGTRPNIYNGVYVQGGSLISNGKLNVTFKGVASDETKGSEAYLNHQIRSHAVRVEGAGTDTKVTIASGTILNGTRDTNDTVIAGSGIGGGILVNGGTVTLGVQNLNSGPTVQTTGTENYDFNNTDFKGNWNYKVTETGGDAVKVANGNLTIYGGEYTSKQGNGILVQQNETGTSYQAEVYGGTFSGDDVYSSNTGNDSFYTGPGASYAFKVLSGNLIIKDGLFSSADGGAFVMNGTATMKGGIIAANGATGLAVWTGATVNISGDPIIAGASTGLAVETNTVNAPTITIEGGTFSGGKYSNTEEGIEIEGSGSDRNGIWYGNGNAKLTISGGTFQGDNRSGLYFGVVPSGSNVQLSGGTYYGKDNDVYWNGRFDHGNKTGGNAIDGSQNISYNSILNDAVATGYTDFNGTFDGSGAEIDGNYTTDSTLSNIQQKGSMTFRTGAGWVDYPVNLVYSRIEIS